MSTIDDVNRSEQRPRSPLDPPPRRFPLAPRWSILLAAVLAQVVMGLAIAGSSTLGVAHAAAVLAVGVYAALTRNLVMTLCVIVYVSGSEVMWRQATVPIPYLAAPYIVIVLSAFALLVALQTLGKDARLAALYVALMLPAAINTIRTIGPEAREAIAFALSGPVALATFLAITSQVKAAPWAYRRMLWTAVVSSIGPLTIAISRLRADILTSGAVDFRSESNFQASGGFGPVQVSSMLSFGILCAVLLIVMERDRGARILAGVICIPLTVQTLLTFSRGGSFSVIVAVTVLALGTTTDRRSRQRVLAIAAVAAAVAYLLVFPWVESFTDGAFQERFSDTSSGRTELAANDTEIFRRNIVLGVGPGMTKYQRLTYEVCQIRSDKCREEGSSHTEFTRMLGEHGIPGIISLGVLVVLTTRAYRRTGAGRAFGVTLLAWAVAQMFYANLRITAVPIAFGLAFLRISEPRAESAPDDSGEPDDSGRATHTAAPASGSRLTQERAERPIGFGAGYGTRGRSPGTGLRPSREQG